MVFIPAPNVVEVRFVHEYLGQKLTNSIYYEHTAPPTQSDLQDLAVDAAQLWASQVIPNLSGDLVFREVYCRELSFQQSFVFSYTGNPLPLSGQAFGQPMPSSVCVVVSLRTGLAGRSARGRLYIGGLTELQVDGDFPNEGLRNALRNAVVQVLDGLTTTARYPVVVSKFTNKQPRSVAVTNRIIAVLVSTTRVGSQRNRLP